MSELYGEIAARLAKIDTLKKQLSEAETMLANQDSLNSRMQEASEANQRQIYAGLGYIHMGSELEFQTELAALIFAVNKLTCEESRAKADLLRRIGALLGAGAAENCSVLAALCSDY